MALASAGAAAAADAPELTAPISEIGLSPEQVSKDSATLASSDLRDAVEVFPRGSSLFPAAASGREILVEVHHRTTSAAARRMVEEAGGTVNGEVEGWLVQAWVPVDRLQVLEARPGIRFLKPPNESVPHGVLGPPSEPDRRTQSGATTGAHVVESNADEWLAQGWDGTGVRVGLIDLFSQPDWDAAVASGDLPVPSGTFCRWNGTSCDIWSGPAVPHGNNVAEIAHDMAPGAELYLATAGTTADTQAAIDYFAAQGVDIVSRSSTADYDGPGDGTGPLAAVVDNAVANGMAWFNSVGNSAMQTSNGLGTYWRGEWADADGDGWLEFALGDEALGFFCGFMNGVRWSDWGDPAATDYDVIVHDGSVVLDSSTDHQPAADPLELVDECGEVGDVAYLQISVFAANGGTDGDVIEFMANQSFGFEHSSNPFSASGPVVDTASPGAMAVGAIDPIPGDLIADYSSRGPTNDLRVKPDMSASSCIATTLMGCFAGTSASAPTMAGAAALVLQSGMATTPAELVSYLRTSAAADRGEPGPDNDYGAGELLLPAPPGPVTPLGPPGAPTGVTVVGGDTIATVSWKPPADDGGDPDLTYTVTGTPGGTCTTTAPTITCTVTGLPNGTVHTFSVTATNAAGTSAPSTPSPPVTPLGPPGAPTGVTVVGGDTIATVSWKPPADDGGDPDLTYTVTGTPGGTCTTTAPTITCTVTGLPNGTVHTFSVTATNAAGTSAPSTPSPPVTQVLPAFLVDCSGPLPTPFTDVSVASFAYDDIGCIHTLNVTTGTSPTTYAPDDDVTREQMAAFLARLYRTITGLPCTSGPTPFTDVSVASFAYDDIGCIHTLNVTTGTSPTTYAPQEYVTREQMAAFLARLYRTITGLPCTSGPTPFTDVSVASFAYDDIGCIHSLNVTTGTSPTTYAPQEYVTREQMAAFLARLYRTIVTSG